MPTRPPVFNPRYAPKPSEFRGSAAQRGYDGDWKRFRYQYLQRNPICCFRDHPAHRDECTTAATVVDHIRPLAQGGGRLDEANVRPCCRRAHEVITQNLKNTGRNELEER